MSLPSHQDEQQPQPQPPQQQQQQHLHLRPSTNFAATPSPDTCGPKRIRRNQRGNKSPTGWPVSSRSRYPAAFFNETYEGRGECMHPNILCLYYVIYWYWYLNNVIIYHNQKKSLYPYLWHLHLWMFVSPYIHAIKSLSLSLTRGLSPWRRASWSSSWRNQRWKRQNHAFPSGKQGIHTKTLFNYTRSMIRKYRLIIDIQTNHMYTSIMTKCINVWFSHSSFFRFLLDFFKNLKTTSFTGTFYKASLPGLQVQEEQHAQAQNATQSSFCLLYPIAQQHEPQVLLSGMIGSPTVGGSK